MSWKSLTKEQRIAAGLFFDEKNINTAIEGLKKLKKIFNNYSISFFLDCGTLLGCIREGKLINIDVDVDIGVLGEHWNQEVTKEFKKLPSWKSGETRFCNDQRLADIYFGGENKGVYFSCAYVIGNSQIPIDVYIHQVGEGTFKGRRVNLMTGRTYNSDYFSSFIEKKLCSVDFLVPIMYKEYLDDIYVGRQNWIIPLLDLK